MARNARTPAASRRVSRYPDLWIYLFVLAAVAGLYSQVRHFDFINFDDPDYVSANPHVRNGLTTASVHWAFTAGDAANWFPVTRLSHILDVQFFGLDPGAHHLINAIIHALAACMLFAFLNRATRARWRSAFVAVLFAIHPLHVESVAWVSERKDVLSALFFFSALWAWVRYAQSRAPRWYLATLLAFSLGLMSKPMVVTLPFVLLLLDAWPLARFAWRRSIFEKIPFFALASLASLVTYVVQRRSGAVQALSVSFSLRIENALVSYVVYLRTTFWPNGLAAFYPYPLHLELWQPALAATVLLGVSLAVLREFRKRPYLTVGWFWFVGTLVPVIGFVQVGAQAHADRYMYIPMVGLLIMLAWGSVDLWQRWPGIKPALVSLGAAACATFAVLTWIQIGYWQNSESLFSHALNVTHDNDVAEHNLGTALIDQPDRLPEAITHLKAATRIRPASAKAHIDLGSALSRLPGRLSEAVAEYRTALSIAPDSAIAHNNLGNTLSEMPGRLEDAIAEYRLALRIDPAYAEAHNNLGSTLARSNQLREATAEFQEALRLNPDYAQARTNLQQVSSLTAVRAPRAVSEFEAALRLHPDSAELHYNFGVALTRMPNRLREAASQFEAALRLQPTYPEAHNDLGVILAGTPGRLPQAISHFEAALRAHPDYADAHYNLGAALAQMGGNREALIQFEAAQRIKPDPELKKLITRLHAAQP